MVEVREAATVLVLRPARASESRGWSEIYMVRRSARSTFMPSTLVFPGGGLEPADGPAGQDASFAHAARRECREEASIDLGERPLTWFDTWKTPSGESPRRFLARFFFAEIDHEEGEAAQHDGREVTAGVWIEPTEALNRWSRGDIDLPPPTLSILLHLRTEGVKGLALADHQELRAPIVPKVISEADPAEIVMPHDPRYASVPGEGSEAPPRVHRYPRGFRRDQGRWRAL